MSDACTVCNGGIKGDGAIIGDGVRVCDDCRYQLYLAKQGNENSIKFFEERISKLAEKTQLALVESLPSLNAIIETESQKVDYANSLGEYYEYDIETVINEDHGCVDKKHMLEILGRRSREGWKLHTIYSNELGKNAIRVLGFGVNATACEDVMVFERRIQEL